MYEEEREKWITRCMYNEVDVNEVEGKKRRTEAERRDREGDNYVRIIMEEGEREKTGQEGK